MCGATTSAALAEHSSQRFFFAPLGRDGLSGVAAFFKLPKKSPRFGIGISSPCFVF
jgi:hypothetical protein